MTWTLKQLPFALSMMLILSIEGAEGYCRRTRPLVLEISLFATAAQWCLCVFVFVRVHIQCHSAPAMHPECTVPQRPCSPGWGRVIPASFGPVAGRDSSCPPHTHTLPSPFLLISVSSVLGELFPAVLPTKPPCIPEYMPRPAIGPLEAASSMPAFQHLPDCS